MARDFPDDGVHMRLSGLRELPCLDARDEVLGLLADPGSVLELERRQLRLAGVLLDVRAPAAEQRLFDMLVRNARVLDGLEDLPARVAAVDPGVGTRVNLDRHGAENYSVRSGRYV